MKDQLTVFYYHMVEFQKKNLWALLFLLAVFTGVMLFFALRIEVDSTLEQQIKPQDPYLTLKGVMADEFGQTDSFFVVLRVDNAYRDTDGITDLRHPEAIQAIDRLERSVSQEAEVSGSVSIASTYRAVFGRLPATMEESIAWERLLNTESFFSKDKSASIINVSVNIPKKLGAVGDAETRMQQRVQDAALPAGVTAILTGTPTLINQIINLMIRDSLTTLGIALIFVFFALLFFYRNLSLSLIAVAPLILSTIWLGGAMSLLGVRISVANATVAAMVIGLGVAYGVHLVNSFDNAVKKNRSKPIRNTVRIVGSAVTISFLTTLVGFSVNLLASTEALRVQGLTLSMGIIFAFIATMLVIPLLLKLKIEILREEFGGHRWK